MLIIRDLSIKLFKFTSDSNSISLLSFDDNCADVNILTYKKYNCLYLINNFESLASLKLIYHLHCQLFLCQFLLLLQVMIVLDYNFVKIKIFCFFQAETIFIHFKITYQHHLILTSL